MLAMAAERSYIPLVRSIDRLLDIRDHRVKPPRCDILAVNIVEYPRAACIG